MEKYTSLQGWEWHLKPLKFHIILGFGSTFIIILILLCMLVLFVFAILFIFYLELYIYENLFKGFYYLIYLGVL